MQRILDFPNKRHLKLSKYCSINLIAVVVVSAFCGFRKSKLLSPMSIFFGYLYLIYEFRLSFCAVREMQPNGKAENTP